METGVFTRRSGLIARLLALALLCAQFGAAAHAYSHLSDDAKGGPASTQICGVCMSFTPLTGAVGSAPQAFLLDPCVEAAVAPADSTAIPAGPAHRAFRSRAPPILR